MEIKENYDLTGLNTFHIPARARYFTILENQAGIEALLKDSKFKENQKLFLGGGSNVLFTQDFDGVVILNHLKGIEILEENSESVLIRSLGGEWWHDLVTFTVERGYWGIENLSLIPGSVGAAPMQNIGAYGVELKDTLDSVEAYDIQTGEKRVFSNEECRFGYRDSVFKNELKGQFFILAVTVRLSKKENKKIEYRVLKEYLEKNKIEVRSSKDVADAVANIRRSKLPDPKDLGNSGSFFKNVFLSPQEFNSFIQKFPDVPSFKEDDYVKIPTAWLIESCGFKGYRLGDAGVHEKQALVLVNYGNATGTEILALANKIIDAVYQKFGLKITPEVNLI